MPRVARRSRHCAGEAISSTSSFRCAEASAVLARTLRCRRAALSWRAVGCFVAVLTLIGCSTATADGARGTENGARAAEASLPVEDLSAARRLGGRKAVRAWRGRLAERKGKRPRRDGEDRPGDPGGNRPQGPDRTPTKPDPSDHANRDDRDGGRPGGADQPPGSRDDPQPRTPRGIPSDPPHVICIGGRVRDGACGCDGARVRLSAEQRIFNCLPPRTFAALSGATSWLRSDPPRGRPPDPGRSSSPGGRPAPSDPPDDFVPNEVLATVAWTAPESTDDAVARSHGLELIERHAIALIERRIIRYRIQDGRSVAAVLAALRADPRGLDPQPNYVYRLQQDTAPSRAIALQYALSKLDVLRAQTLASGRGALIAVIDTGVDATHPDLAGAIVDSFDAVGASASSDPHGTAVAGIVAAHGLLRGVAPDARLLDVRAFAPPGADGAAGAAAATTVNLLRGLAWAVERQARILNMSFTGPRDPLLQRAVTTASARGAILVAAAGNGGVRAPFAYPAAYPQVIAVTAIDGADRLYAQANQGPYIAVAAPGVDILAASAEHAHRLLSGTSFAAAHVSGILALMLEREPALTADAARHALMTTAHDLGAPGPDDQFGVGRPDAFAALQALATE
jgi:hypothetical protein